MPREEHVDPRFCCASKTGLEVPLTSIRCGREEQIDLEDLLPPSVAAETCRRSQLYENEVLELAFLFTSTYVRCRLPVFSKEYEYLGCGIDLRYPRLWCDRCAGVSRMTQE